MQQNFITRAIVIGIITATTACSMTTAVTGQLADGSESFSGTGEAGMETAAPFTMTSSNGTTCSGTFDMKSLTGGTGSFTCADGRTGSFDWAASGTGMSGSGTIAGELMTIAMR